MLADNIVLLKKKSPELYERIKKWEDGQPEASFFVEQAKERGLTLKYNNSKSLYVHSKYDPIKEAESIINKLDQEDIDDQTHVVFYGIGLGYHIELFLNRYPNNVFSIIEPSLEVLVHYLNHQKLDVLQKSRMIGIFTKQDIDEFYEMVRQRKDKKIVISELSAYKKVFALDYEVFLKAFRNALKNEKMEYVTTLATQKKWIKNCVKNFQKVLETGNVLFNNNSIFQDKTGVIVAAGPSLNEEIENLKKIKAEGLAYIFSVGSAINTLIYHGIYPDAMCTYDPHEDNFTVFEKLTELKINTIPMIFGSSVGYETLDLYDGPKFHMLMFHDLIASYFLQSIDGEAIQVVHDAPSIAVVTMELMSKLKFKKIVLVGQNLGFLNNRHYADGVSYEPAEIAVTGKTKDVYGNIIDTNDSFETMRTSMEQLVKMIQVEVINTTKGGAAIEGAKFQHLDDLMKNDLNSKIVNGNEFDIISGVTIYNKNYLDEQLTKLKREFASYNGIVENTKRLLLKIKHLFNGSNRQEIIDTFIRINNLLVEMEHNDFFRIFARNLNRTAYDSTAHKINEFKKEKNEIIKIKRSYEPISDLIDQLIFEKKINKLLMDELTAIIIAYTAN